METGALLFSTRALPTRVPRERLAPAPRLALAAAVPPLHLPMRSRLSAKRPSIKVIKSVSSAPTLWETLRLSVATAHSSLSATLATWPESFCATLPSRLLPMPCTGSRSTSRFLPIVQWKRSLYPS